MVVVSFDIEGLKAADDGLVQYSTGMELKDKKGKTLFKKDPQPMEAVTTLGGSRLPAFALTNLYADTVPGEYTLTVVVNDIKGKTSAKLERKFEVKPLQFGIVRPGFVYIGLNEEQAGARPQLAPPVAVPGQNLMVHFTVVGFEQKGDKPQPHVAVTLEVKEESGAAVLKKPFTGAAKELDEELQKRKEIPFSLPIQVNRSGKFKIVLTTKDMHSGKTDTLTLDLKVVEVN